MVIRHSRGRAGSSALILFSESFAMVSSPSIQKGARWMPICKDNHTHRGFDLADQGVVIRDVRAQNRWIKCCRGVGAAWNRSLHKMRYLGLSAVTVDNRCGC